MANAIFNADQAEDLVGAYNEFRVVDGFLRRILKLMFFGIKPVFVFDGQTPALKKKTLQERKKVYFYLRLRLKRNKIFLVVFAMIKFG